MSNLKSKKFIAVGKAIWAMVTISFILFYLIKNHGKFIQFISQVHFDVLLLASLCAISAKIMLAFQMRQSITLVGKPVSFKHSIYIYSICDVSKYIPGGIWAVTLRGVLYKGLGLNLKESFKSMSLEYVWLLGSGLLFGSCCSIFVFSVYLKHIELLHYHINLVKIFPFLILFILLSWYVGMQALNYLFIKKTLSWKFIIVFLIRQVFIWSLFGVSIYILAPPTSLSSFNLFLLSIGALSLGKILGILVIIAPGGLGMREGVITFILAFFVPGDTALFIALSNRVILFSSDILLGIFSVLFLKNTTLKYQPTHLEANDAKL